MIKTQIFVWQTSIEFKHLDKPPSLFADVVDVDVRLPGLLHDSSSCVLGMLWKARVRKNSIDFATLLCAF